MNREIKFRAWQNKEMFSWQQMIDRYIEAGSEGIKIEFPMYMLNDNGIVWMQFTGLKDKNGKEIYESDIVKWDDMTNGERWRVAVVEINPDIQFRIVRVNLDIVQSAKDGYVFRFGRFIYTDTHNHLEVIGNIYSNQELLETKHRNLW